MLKKILKRGGKFLAIVVLFFVVGYALLCIFVQPSNNRDWAPDLVVLPYTEFNGDTVTVHNIRNITYRTVLDYDVKYYDKTFDLNRIVSTDFIVQPFGSLSAHTMIAFGFEDGSFVDVSVEVRREKGEWFDAVKGLFRQFELTYVVADENDVLKLRTNVRENSPVYMYPIKTTKERMRRMFVDMLERANGLKEKPEMYNTLTNNCTTNIVRAVNDVVPGRVPWSYKYVFPSYSDELAVEIGLVQDTGTMEEVRARHYINPAAAQYGNDPAYSKKIRENLPEYKNK